MTRLTCRRGQRGFSLLEVVIASAVQLLLLAVLVAWLGDMFGQGRTSEVAVGLREQGQRAAVLLRADVAGAVACDPYGYTGPVTAWSGSDLWLHTDGDGDGDVDLVGWRLRSGRLERALDAGTGGSCPDGASLGPWATLATGVTGTGDGAAVFTGMRDGLVVTAGDCTLDPQACEVDVVRVTATLTTALRDASAALDERIALP